MTAPDDWLARRVGGCELSLLIVHCQRYRTGLHGGLSHRHVTRYVARQVRCVKNQTTRVVRRQRRLAVDAEEGDPGMSEVTPPLTPPQLPSAIIGSSSSKARTRAKQFINVKLWKQKQSISGTSTYIYLLHRQEPAHFRLKLLRSFYRPIQPLLSSRCDCTVMNKEH